jgi:hypothetical protein
MKTTALVIEYLVAGILTLVSLLLLNASLFPAELSTLLAWSRGMAASLAGAAFAVVTALAYAVGVLAEHLGHRAFEWKLDSAKIERLPKYLRSNVLKLERSPFLAGFADRVACGGTFTTEEALSAYGLMRFHVRMSNEPLSQGVESQLSRLRLIRPLFLIWIVLGLAVARQLFRSPSALPLVGLVCIGLAAWLNVKAVLARIDRYCRDIERSYQVLVFEGGGQAAEGAPSSTTPSQA